MYMTAQQGHRVLWLVVQVGLSVIAAMLPIRMPVIMFASACITCATSVGMVRVSYSPYLISKIRDMESPAYFVSVKLALLELALLVALFCYSARVPYEELLVRIALTLCSNLLVVGILRLAILISERNR